MKKHSVAWPQSVLWPCSTFLEGLEQGFEFGPGSGRKAVGVELVDIYWVAYEDDTDHHAHKHVRPAGDHIDPGHGKRCLDVLAHLSIEGLSTIRDHAWHRVNLMPLFGGDKVDRVAWFDPDTKQRKGPR